MQDLPITVAGRKKLEDELRVLRDDRRPAVAADVAKFREMGDLRENGAYHAAREELGMIDAKIRLLEDKLARSYLVDMDKLPRDKVVFGSTVKVQDMRTREVESFTLVGEGESDPDTNKILTSSPLAQALLTHKVGDVVTVKLPRRDISYKILDIGFE